MLTTEDYAIRNRVYHPENGFLYSAPRAMLRDDRNDYGEMDSWAHGRALGLSPAMLATINADVHEERCRNLTFARR